MSNTVLQDGDGALYVLARRVIEENIAAGRTIALAESCTGGMVATALTDVPGSSAAFSVSFVTYSDQAKQNLLGVSSDILETFGAVSLACVWAMACGALARGEADVAVAISGIAGPDGGSNAKPVGTVVFARALKGMAGERAFCIQRQFDPNASRSEIRRQAALYALELLLPEADTLHPAP